jgi:hypothetical protein
MPECHATYKCGITSDGWSTKPGFERYFHPFGSMLDNLTMTQFVHNADARINGSDVYAHPDRFFIAARLAAKHLAAVAQAADLAPGDAIYIPALWWHHVESLEPFNVLVNYWWHEVVGDGALADSAFDALLHGILAIRGLPPATRRAWGDFFEQYVFGNDAGVTAHIPEQRRGILGTLSAEQAAGLRAHLAKRLGP